MHRRRLLATIAGGASLSGCLSREGTAPSDPTNSPTGGDGTPTSVRRTADSITATFRVVDSHRPTADSASATFEEQQVTVTGTMDRAGCNRPALAGVRYNPTDEVVHLTIGTESRFGPTATVECGNASFDYRCILSAERGQPTAVEVLHSYEGKDIQSFNLERD